MNLIVDVNDVELIMNCVVYCFVEWCLDILFVYIVVFSRSLVLVDKTRMNTQAVMVRIFKTFYIFQYVVDIIA